MRRRAFTLLELLVVITVIAILMAIMIPALARARELSRHATCATNLSSIGSALITYSSENGIFPTQPPPAKANRIGKWNVLPAPFIDDPTDPVQNCYTNTGSAGSPSYPSMGAPMANLWLLVIGHPNLNPKVFVCPSDNLVSAPSTVETPPEYLPSHGKFENFNPGTFSYSFAYPWVSTTGPVAPCWRGVGSSSTVIGADIGPSLSLPDNNPKALPGAKAGNSKNHRDGEGQNVLYADSHVEWSKRNNVGQGNDNIYTGDHDNICVQNGGAQFTTATGLNADPLDVALAPGRP